MKRTLLTLVSIFAVISAYAEITVKASAPSTVAVGQQFRVEYSVNDKATEIRADIEGKGFDVLYGPASGSMSSTQIINGNVTRSITTTFTYTLLATAEGTFTIPAATVKVNGDQHTSNSLTIKVLPADKQDEAGSTANSRKNQQGVGEKVNVDDVHLDLSLSKTDVYEGEAMVATLKLYFRNTPIHSLADAKLPDFDGFTVQDMDLGNPEASLERYKGANYQMYPIKQWLLFPSRTGEITIPKAYVEAVAQVVTRRSTGGWFDFPMDYTSNVEVPLYSAQRTVKVKPLPAGKPVGYSNGVGDFSIKTEMTSNQVKANDALIYRIVIEGTGNLKYVNNPEPEFPADFEVYDPKEDYNARTTSQGLTGRKVIEITIIPRHAGTFTIPGFDFSYFDVKTGKYKTITTETYTLEVEKGIGDSSENSGNVSNFTNANQERLKVLGNDIRYIHKLDAGDITKNHEPFHGTMLYWMFYLVPMLVFIILSIIYRKQMKLNANADLRRTKKANKVANKRLKEANMALKARNQSAFYESLHKAMFGYVSDKLNIKISELTSSNVKQQLENAGVSEAVIDQYNDIVSTCEFARYAPASDDQAMDSLYKKASDCINSLESQIKK